jgi:hypothetical protein
MISKFKLHTINEWVVCCILFSYWNILTLRTLVFLYRLKFAFLLFDEDNNGVITKSELVSILKANHMAKSDAEVNRKAETIMSQADKNGDGVMSFDEFVTVSKKFPNILFPSYNKR